LASEAAIVVSLEYLIIFVEGVCLMAPLSRQVPVAYFCQGNNCYLNLENMFFFFFFMRKASGRKIISQDIRKKSSSGPQEESVFAA